MNMIEELQELIRVNEKLFDGCDPDEYIRLYKEYKSIDFIPGATADNDAFIFYKERARLIFAEFDKLKVQAFDTWLI